MRIVIETIPQDQIPAGDVGNYWIDENGDWQVRVAEMQDWRDVFLVALHELVELAQVHHDSISIAEIDAWDLAFAKDQAEGRRGEREVAGDDPDAPYAEAHCVAEGVERVLCAMLDRDWKDYETALENA